jgi:NAD(P)-dependent dehydrogenase (short-subunit alcohol dehydrogenase family)
MPTLFPGVALVTGAAGTGWRHSFPTFSTLTDWHVLNAGIGAGVAKAFASAGCTRIAITDLNEKLLNDTLMSIAASNPSVKLHAVAGDISNEKFVNAFIEEVVHKFGRLDYVVNCAGILGSNKPSGEETLEDFDRVNNVNYRGLWLCSRAEIRVMLKQDVLESHDGDGLRGQRGSIVNIASQLGIVGRPGARGSPLSPSGVW